MASVLTLSNWQLFNVHLSKVWVDRYFNLSIGIVVFGKKTPG